MTAIEAVVLGLIQGLTEFLPVSSSGHLVIGQTLFGLEDGQLAFDILLHGATLLAILVYFRRRLADLVRPAGRTYVLKLALATVPVVIVGPVVYPWVREAFTEPALVAGFLALTGALLLSLYLRPEDERADTGALEPGWRTALAIGVFQTCALLPGISRSGTTIVAGIWLGLAPAAAAEFSFLLAIPAILGAIVYESGALRTAAGTGMADVFAIGSVAAFVSAIAAIGLVFRLVDRRRFRWLGFYCLVVAAVFGAWLASRPT
ncbi:MAG: undecaprenyl-diphosphate phosphatase [Gemmatimonadota bacterium]